MDLPSPALITPTAVARLRGASPRTVTRALNRGDLSYVPIHDAEGNEVARVVRLRVALAWKPRPNGRPRKEGA